MSGEPIGQWVAMQMGGFYTPEHSEAIGLERYGQLVAGIIYEDWNHQSVVCHIAIQGRITPEWLFAISEYAYIALGVHKIIAPCYTDNVRAMKILPKMGFVEEGRLKDAQPNGDVVLFTMARDRCRYLGARYSARFPSQRRADYRDHGFAAPGSRPIDEDNPAHVDSSNHLEGDCSPGSEPVEAMKDQS